MTEYSPFTDKGIFNFKLKNLVKTNPTDEVETTSKVAQSKRISVEGSKAVDVGELIGGFLTLSKNTKQNQTITDEPIVSVVTEEVPGVTTTKVSSSKGDIATLTGTTTEDGQLDTLIVTANPAGIKAALQEAFNASDNQIKSALRASSPVPDKVEEASTEDISATVTNDAKKVVRKANRSLGNPLGSSNPFGSLGNSFGNILANALGKFTGAGASTKVGEVLPGKPPGFIVPEGFDEPVDIISEDGSTNIDQSTVPTNNITSAAKPSRDPYILSSNVSGWKGVRTELITGQNQAGTDRGTYEFTIVHTTEELEAELRNTTRDITTAVTHWTKTHSDANLNAYHIHRLHLAAQWESLGGDEDAFKLLVDQGPKNGIEWHYCILKDGTIQRGRPIDVESADGVGFKKHAIHIGFVAGYTAAFGTPNSEFTLGPDSITSQQWKSFDQFLDAFYRAYPGGEALSHNKINKQSTCPGFDVTTYTESKYNKVSVYEDPSQLEEAFSPEEQISRKPTKTVKSSTSTIEATPNIEDLATADESTVITDETLDDYVLGYDKAEREVRSLRRDIVSRKKRLEEIQNDPIHDAESFRLNQQINNKQALLDVKKKDLDQRRRDLMNNGYTYNGSVWSK